VRLRLAAVSFVALAFAFAQISGGAVSLLGDARAYASSLDGSGPSTTVQASDNSDSSSDNSDSSSDNSDSSSDNSDSSSDNSDSSSDNSDDSGSSSDNSDGSSSSADSSSAAPIDDEALKQPLNVASGTSNGGDTIVATAGERVAIHIFPWMPSGVQVTIRPVDANSVSAAPGKRAGDLAFAVDALDASGTQLSSLPAEVNLAIRYADTTVSGLNEGNLTLSRLDPSTNQWQVSPKLVRAPESNYMAASITALGTYVVSAP